MSQVSLPVSFQVLDSTLRLSYPDVPGVMTICRGDLFISSDYSLLSADVWSLVLLLEPQLLLRALSASAVVLGVYRGA